LAASSAPARTGLDPIATLHLKSPYKWVDDRLNVVVRLCHTIMSAQYRFSLIHVLGLLTLAAGAIAIVMACLSIAGWIFGFGVFPFLNQSGARLGITPDAALCFI